MLGGKDYLREIQKFTTSQYWNSGLRITAGVMVPLIILVKSDRLVEGIPFLWGALFVSLTDTPGPIHHRRNGMIAAIVLNTLVVFITAWTKEHQLLLLIQIAVFGFFLSLASIYGSRAGAVGVLALIVMLLNLLSQRNINNAFIDSFLIGAGGIWYMIFSLVLYRFQPYRPVEQALGEYIIAIANYVRARATFYKEDADLKGCFNRVMEEHISVLTIQDQTQELLFKTRKFVADASPKSRSMMMIYLDSLDLFEYTMYAYQDYELLHKQLDETDLLKKFYGLILQLAAEIEHIGISVQTGIPVKKDLDLTAWLGELQDLISQKRSQASEDQLPGLKVLEKTLGNINSIANRINKLVLYTRMEINTDSAFDDAQSISRVAVSQPFTFNLLLQNFTLKSNSFRHSLRLTIAMVIAYGVSILFSLAHTYWVLLTIVTILKPVYSVTRKRNFQRVGGTLVGVILVSILLYFVVNKSALLVIMIFSMLIGYSLLRLNYFGFVVFLTVFIIISFHFLNPIEFGSLIRERMMDTLIGSAIAFFVSRFIFPVWGHEEIKDSMIKMMEANHSYFSKAWEARKTRNKETVEYEAARQDAMVCLTNLSDNFQRMLAEPKQSDQSASIHQFVIANHMLTSHIAALSEKPGQHEIQNEEAERVASSIKEEIKTAEILLRKPLYDVDLPKENDQLILKQTLNQLSMIYTLAKDIRKISGKLSKSRSWLLDTRS